MVGWVLLGGAAALLFVAGSKAATQASDFSHTFGAGHLENIENLKISGFTAKVNIFKGKPDEIIIRAENIIESDFKCGVGADKTLTISYKPKIFGISLPFLKKSTVDIYIPEGKFFENCRIEQGVGNIDIEYIKTGNLKISGGVGVSAITGEAGNLDISGGVGQTAVKGKISGRIKISGGVGQVDLDSDGNIDDLKIAGGIGEIKIRGPVDGDVKVSGGMGEIKLDIKGDINKYNIKSNTGMGTIRINGEKAGNYINVGAPHKLKIDGGMGNITVNIK